MVCVLVVIIVYCLSVAIVKWQLNFSVWRLKTGLPTDVNLSTPTVYWYKIQSPPPPPPIILGGGGWGDGHIGKWIQENIIFMRFCRHFKLSKKIEKLLNEQPTHAITKCTLTDWWKWDLKLHVYFMQLCFFLPLPHVLVGIQNAAATSGKIKTSACIREIQVHKLWTKAYSQKGVNLLHALTQLCLVSLHLI